MDLTFIGQQNRLVKLTTPLGPDTLLPQRVHAHEQLGRHYDYTIDCLSERDGIELKRLIAQPDTLWIQQADHSYLPVHGYVHTAKRLGSDGQFTYCQISLAPWVHFLKFRKDARIWQDKTADEILCDVFNGHPQAQGNFRFDVREPAVQRSYCTQYETDWHFVQRLMEEEGWFSYHEQRPDGSGHVLVITDNTDQLKPTAQESIHFHGAGTEDELHKIVHWGAGRRLSSSKFAVRTHDYKSAALSKQASNVVGAAHGDLPGQLEVYEYTGAYTYSTQEQGDKQALLRTEQSESSMKRFSAVSGVRSVPVGAWFIFEGHPAHRDEPPEDRQFLVVAVEWCIENNLPLSNKIKDFPDSLASRLEATKVAMGRGTASSGAQAAHARTGHCLNRMEVQRRKVPFRSPFEHAKPALHPQTAVVVGPENEEIHTDHLNRVKVQFRWDRENPGDERASCWVRVSYPNAGRGWGALNVPRIAQEVIVTFLDGDADRPVITGRLYNEEQAPIWHTDGKLSGYKSKEYKGNGFNQLVLDDTTQQNRIQLYSTNTHAQLNLGYLVTQNGNKRGSFYGSGFSLSTVAEKISLFAFNAGIKLFASKGKVEVQAQSNDLDLIAEKVVRLLSTNARIEIHAKEEVMISAGGSFIKIDSSGISNGTPGKWVAQASLHEMPGPARKPYVMPHMLKPELERLIWSSAISPIGVRLLAGAAYKATLSDGSVRQGMLDALGIARISGVPAGATAKIEYDYKPLEASSTVSAEMDEDVQELLNWAPRNMAAKGKA